MSSFESVRWGILGLGNIANAFAEGLTHTPGARLTAVASRSPERADRFAERHDVARRYASYEALAADPEVDAVYIATRHPQHAENALLCIEAGKHVLVEKPFAMNAAEAEGVIDAARVRGLLCVEAMWTRFTPLMGQIGRIARDGRLGQVRLLTADFGFSFPFDPAHRLFDPALGGGALLDVGCYPLALASLVFGKPVEVAGMAHLGESGVDEHCAITLRHACGGMALIAAASRVQTNQEACLYGTDATLRIHAPWWLLPRAATISRSGHHDELIQVHVEGNGYQYQALDFAECLREGRTESSVMPLGETLSILRTMDQLRSQWGLRYPGEADYSAMSNTV